MRLKIRIGLLLCLMSAAVISCCAAYRSMHRVSAGAVPEEVYAQFMLGDDSAEYNLRDRNGRVADYAGRRDKSPLSVTAIETAGLRSADRAMLRGGIPVADTQALLRLLEDLGS